MKKILYNNSWGFIGFFGGLILSVVFKTWASNIFQYQSPLIIAIIGLIFAAGYYFKLTNDRIQELADKVELTLRYVDENYFDKNSYTGYVYLEMEKLVSQAKKRIMILGTPAVQKGKKELTADHKSRLNYLNTIENTVKKNIQRGFKYIRIEQIPTDCQKMPVAECMKESTLKHCSNIFEFSKSTELNFDRINSDVCVMTIPMQRFGSLMIVDEQTIVIEILGIDNEANPFAKSMLFIEDKGGKLVKHFEGYFEHLQRIAKNFASINDCTIT